MATPASPDWLQGRLPLPILFASQVDHPERDHFRQLRSQVANADALDAAQAILIRCGGISYTVAHLLTRHHQATVLLHTLALPRPAPLTQLLDEIIAPVRSLLAAVTVVDADRAEPHLLA